MESRNFMGANQCSVTKRALKMLNRGVSRTQVFIPNYQPRLVVIFTRMFAPIWYGVQAPHGTYLAIW